MKQQLALLDEHHAEWRLDERTRQTGRQGVQKAREALRRAARSVEPPPDHPTGKAA